MTRLPATVTRPGLRMRTMILVIINWPTQTMRDTASGTVTYQEESNLKFQVHDSLCHEYAAARPDGSLAARRRVMCVTVQVSESE